MKNSFSSPKSASATTVGDETEKKRMMGANGKHPADRCNPFWFLVGIGFTSQLKDLELYSIKVYNNSLMATAIA
jgi:hypothetical protein